MTRTPGSPPRTRRRPSRLLPIQPCGVASRCARVERIEADRRELARLCVANDVLAKAAQEPGRRGLRARLKEAETDLAQARWALHEAKAMGSTRATITDAHFETGCNSVRFAIIGRQTDLLLTEQDVTILRDALDREDSARTAEIATLRADIARMTRTRSEGEAKLAAEVVRLRAELADLIGPRGANAG